jgi:hypothetical protein
VIRFMQRFRLLSVLVVIPLMLVGCGVNDIPTKQVKAQAAWGDVQSQYQRRADLVPNLVATVQGMLFKRRRFYSKSPRPARRPGPRRCFDSHRSGSFLRVISKCEHILAEHFPANAEHSNELPDTLIES